MYTEVIGKHIVLNNYCVKLFSELPPLDNEIEEYTRLENNLCLIYDNTTLSRQIFITVNKEVRPSCWLSFQFLKNRKPEVLIVNMRSCSIEIFGSDLGFVCRLALKLAANKNEVECIWNIGSLHYGVNK